MQKILSGRAQGTIEYLVIIAAVVVVALVTVVLLTNQMGSVEGAAKNSSEIGSMVGVGGISIVEAVAGLDTNGLLVLKNSGSDPLTVNKISVDGVDHNFSEPIVFDGEKIFLLNGIDACNGTNKSYSVKVYYTGLNGVSKVADFKEITVDCTPAVAPSDSFVEETEVSTFTVVYFGNGSTGGSVPVDSNRYESSATVTVLGNTGSLVKSGYSFVGWNTQADGLGADRNAGSAFSMGSADVNLYAKWSPTYTVTYFGNGSTGGSVPADSNNYLSGATAYVLGNRNNLVKGGYTFVGWNSHADGSDTNRTAGYAFSIGSADVNWYAMWNREVDPCTGGASDPDCWSDNLGFASWGPAGDTLADSSTNGAANTAILAALEGSYPAADACAALDTNGYTNWYLPAYQQLLDASSAHIPGFTYGGWYFYWSSTEYTTNPSVFIWLVFYINIPPYTVQTSYDSRSNDHHLVRCLR